MAPFTISISNKSGSKQSYGIFAGLPEIKVSGSSSPQVVRRIITSVHYVASNEGQAIFTLSKDWLATCGIYDVDTSTSTDEGKTKRIGSGTEVVDLRPVQLGRIDVSHGGTKIQGTFLEIECANGTPSFTKSTTPIPDVDVDYFAIRTRKDFTLQEARANKYVVGFTSARRQNIGSYGTFIPSPNAVYNIKPTSTLYIAKGDYNVGDLIPPKLDQDESTCRVDFNKLATDLVNIVHDDRGELNIITVQPPELQTASMRMRVFSPSLSSEEPTSLTPNSSDTERDD